MQRNLRALENAVVTANPSALAGVALRGAHARVVQMHNLTSEAVDRLGVKCTGVKAMTGGGDNYPSVHDVKRWLDGLTKEDKEGVDLLKQFHVTLSKRV